jgi:hypothetical protein
MQNGDNVIPVKEWNTIAEEIIQKKKSIKKGTH